MITGENITNKMNYNICDCKLSVTKKIPQKKGGFVIINRTFTTGLNVLNTLYSTDFEIEFRKFQRMANANKII